MTGGGAHPSGLMKPIALTALIAFACPALVAQSINIDIGANTLFPAPAPGFGGAIAQPGSWNAITGVASGPLPLVDVNGAATGATIETTGGSNTQFNSPVTFGAIEDLMDDAQQFPPAGVTWTVSGLLPGAYRVIVYAWDPSTDGALTTTLALTDGALGPLACTGPLPPGQFLFDDTHVGDTARVTIGTPTLTITLTSSGGGGRCNGIQIERQPPQFGAAVRGPYDLQLLTGQPETTAVCGNYETLTTASQDGGGGNFMCKADPASSPPTSIGVQPGICSAEDAASTIDSSTGEETVLIGNCKYTYDASGNLIMCSLVGVREAVAVSRDQQAVYYSTATSELRRVDLDLVTADTLIGTLPAYDWIGLGWDPTRDSLWGSAQFHPAGGQNNLVLFAELNPTNARLTGRAFLGDTTLAPPNVIGGCEVITDRVTGDLVIVAVHLATGSPDSLVYYRLGLCAPPPQSYCTAGTSSNGCVAVLTGVGAPSASAIDGFSLSATSIEGQKSGLFFYGVTGRIATTWGAGSSFLCVKSPTQRMSSQSSGGTAGLCNGVYVQDWLDFIRSNSGALGQPLFAGQVIDAQAWYRDPPASKTTNLSNGYEFTLCP